MLRDASWNPFRRADPKEMVSKWKSSIRSEVRRTEREMQLLVIEQKKAAKMIKEAAKRNDMGSAKVIAKEVVRLRGTVARLAANKATLISLSDQMTQTLAMSKVAGSIKSSTAVMQSVTNLARIPQLQNTIKQMAKEMAKAGFIQEMMDDAIDSAVDAEGVDEAVEEQVDAVLQEITGETMAQLAKTPSFKPVVAVPPQAAAAQEEEEEEDGLQAALEGLRAS